ncbi:hypothetical protein HHL17_07070 [Chitinophaga sp. G-6-1-13]|uniref:Lipocalin-like domain-containing protein n=1 Tax=Chitinophaga fulva TaxID=2728842 RepID=A0A848GE70_9BACT|nr:DUF5991 domain-containing protein [Chitinophaga fulva]NML36955.1 hypothetical protein [Chitinophaga fulva]
MLNKYIPVAFLSFLKMFTQGCDSSSNEKDLQFWQGHYEVGASRNEYMNGLQVGTLYEINTTNDSCIFTGDGIQYAFDAKCALKTNKDTLLGYFCYDTRGMARYWNAELPLFKIFRKDTNYYIISSAILEDTTKTYLLKHSRESKKIQ